MHISPADRLLLKDIVLTRHRDWSGVHAALKETHNSTVSQSALNRFFSGQSNSRRTLHTLATLLGTVPEALVNQIHLTARVTLTTTHNGIPQLKPFRDPDAFRIAFQLWVEMTTRKVGLPINPAQDMVIECYDSWHAFFRTTRELIKAIPLYKDPNSAELRWLVQFSQAVLNEGLRPHLERWQARFRRWITSGGDRVKGQGLSPQEAQQLFPEWSKLRDDLLATNRRLISYVGVLETMIARPNSSKPTRMTYRSTPKGSSSTARVQFRTN